MRVFNLKEEEEGRESLCILLFIVRKQVTRAREEYCTVLFLEREETAKSEYSEHTMAKM